AALARLPAGENDHPAADRAGPAAPSGLTNPDAGAPGARILFSSSPPSTTHSHRSGAPASGPGSVRLQRIGDPMTDLVDVSRIRDLNDQLRRSLNGGVLVMTRGIIALGAKRQMEILTAIAAFKDFSPDNDPYGEHD